VSFEMPETKTRKQEIRNRAQLLAQLASNQKIYTPPGLPDPVKSAKK
jgi:hypothetical protein